MVYHNWIRWVQEWIESLRNFSKFHSGTIEYLLKVLVTVDEFPFMRVLHKLQTIDNHILWKTSSNQISFQYKSQEKYNT